MNLIIKSEIDHLSIAVQVYIKIVDSILNNEFKAAQKEHQKDQTISARDLLEQLNNE